MACIIDATNAEILIKNNQAFLNESEFNANERKKCDLFEKIYIAVFIQ